MAHTCPNCGAAVEDNKRYCGECGAPQDVASSASEDRRPGTEPMPPGTPGEMQPPAQPVYPAVHLGGKPPRSDRSLFVRSGLIAGVIGTLAILMGGLFAAGAAAALQPFAFLLMIATGGVAVTFYTRRAHAGISTGRGLKLGLLAGFFGALLLLAITMLGLASSESRAEFRKAVTDTLNTAAAANADTAAKDFAARMISGINTTGGLVAFLLLMMGFAGVVFLILAGLGGAVGAAVFGRAPTSESP